MVPVHSTGTGTGTGTGTAQFSPEFRSVPSSNDALPTRLRLVGNAYTVIINYYMNHRLPFRPHRDSRTAHKLCAVPVRSLCGPCAISPGLAGITIAEARACHIVII